MRLQGLKSVRLGYRFLIAESLIGFSSSLKYSKNTPFQDFKYLFLDTIRLQIFSVIFFIRAGLKDYRILTESSQLKIVVMGVEHVQKYAR